MHKDLYQIDDIDRLYVSRKGGRRGLTNIGGSVDASIQGHEGYIKKSKEILITATRKSTGYIMINRKIAKTNYK